MRYIVAFLRLPSILTLAISQRLSAKTNLKLAKLWLDRREFTRLQRVWSPQFEQFDRRSWIFS